MDLRKTGELISVTRRNLGFTQEELGEKVGVTNTAVSKWERGICFPDIGLLSDLSEILGLSRDELIDGERKEKKESESEKIEKAIEKTIEISEKEIKRKLKKNRKIFIIIVALFFVVTIPLSVCIGIAFTPADGMSNTKEISICAFPSNNVYKIPLKCRANFGDYYAFGSIYYKNKVKYKKQYEVLEKGVESSGGKIVKPFEDRKIYIITFKDEKTDCVDCFTFEYVYNGGEIRPMTLKMQEGFVYFPIYLFEENCKIDYSDFLTNGAEILLCTDINGFSVDYEKEFYDFYTNSGYYEVEREENVIKLRQKEFEKGNGIFSNGIDRTITEFSVKFLTHGNACYCTINVERVDETTT